MKNYLFRVDADKKIGHGHLMRIISLANALETESKKILVTKSDILLMNENFTKTIKIGRNQDLDSELIFTKKIIDHYKINVVICDINYDNSFENERNYYNYFKKLSNLEQSIVSFEDFNIKKTNADLTIIPYVGAENLINQESNLLLGPKYFILRDEFLKNRNKHQYSEIIKNITITMGGTNPNKSIELSIEALSETEFEGNCSVIVGKSASVDLNQLKKITQKTNNNIYFEYHYNIKKFAEKLIESDMVITNSGMTKYETLFLGIPTFCFSSITSHNQIMKVFSDETNSIYYAGTYQQKITELAKKLNTFIYNSELRYKYFKNGQKIIDGKGLLRIINRINSLNNGRK